MEAGMYIGSIWSLGCDFGFNRIQRPFLFLAPRILVEACLTYATADDYGGFIHTAVGMTV